MKYNPMKAILLVLVSGSVQASEIDNLIETSGSLKDTFSLGIQTVGGQLDYMQVGGISPDMVSDAYITQAQATAYNDALAQVAAKNYQVTAQEYFDTQVDDAFDAVNDAIDTYINAASDLVTVVQVNEMAINAVDQETTNQLQTYVTNNELAITTDTVETYNNALETMQNATQKAASFLAVANDQQLVSSAQAQADTLGESFSFAEASYYSQSTVTVSMLSGDVTLDVSGYIKSAQDILMAGQDSDFYRTSPANECFFTQDCY